VCVFPASACSQPTSSGGSCFHGDGTVLLASGATKRLADLEFGDRILTSDGANVAFFPVLMLPHGKNSEPAAFLNLTTETGKFVEMTSDHFIPKCSLEVVTAGALVVGDCVLTVDGKETLTAISAGTNFGVFTAVTEGKFIVVNGIVASPFSERSDVANPTKDFRKYAQELQRERKRKLAYFNSKKAKSMAHPSGGTT
jgi:hypothetical protein